MIRKINRLLVFLVLVIFSGIGTIHAEDPANQWYSETAASSSGSSGIIGIDPHNRIHIYYCTGGQTMHAIKDVSGSWNNSLVANVCGNMAIDSSGNVHVSYFVTEDGLRYGTNRTGTWTSELADTSGTSGPIAVDSAGNIHIVYAVNDVPTDRLQYVTNASGSWITETAYTETCHNYCDVSINLTTAAITTDSSGISNIVFLREISNFISTETESLSVIYLTNETGTWATESVSSVSGYYCIYGSADLATDTSGKAHINYSYRYSEDWMCPPETFSYFTKYATNSSGSWMSATLDNTCSGKTSIAVDSSDNSHVFYCSGYATNKTGEWVSQSVNGSFIAIDSLGYVHTSYISVISGPLYYVTNNPESFVDNDRDGYTENQGDCDDYDANIYPGGPPVRITDMTPIYYWTIQAAYNSALSDDVIVARNMSLTENLIINLNNVVTIDGGYECSYTTVSGKTIINGSMTVIDGAVTAGNIELR